MLTRRALLTSTVLLAVAACATPTPSPTPVPTVPPTPAQQLGVVLGLVAAGVKALEPDIALIPGIDPAKVVQVDTSITELLGEVKGLVASLPTAGPGSVIPWLKGVDAVLEPVLLLIPGNSPLALTVSSIQALLTQAFVLSGVSPLVRGELPVHHLSPVTTEDATAHLKALPPVLK